MEAQTTLPPTLDDRLLTAHLAEYNALTTRCTYWIALQYGLWPLVGVVVVIVAQLWNSTPNHALLVWGSGVLIQLIMLAFNQTLREIYNAIRYLERYVRPSVQILTGQRDVWGYETYNAAQRSPVATWWEYGVPLGVLIALVSLIIVLPLKRPDVIGIGLNGLLFIATVVQSQTIVRIRREFFAGS